MADSLISPALALGVYDVAVVVTDRAGNAASDTTTGELSILPLTPLTPDLIGTFDTGSSLLHVMAANWAN